MGLADALVDALIFMELTEFTQGVLFFTSRRGSGGAEVAEVESHTEYTRSVVCVEEGWEAVCSMVLWQDVIVLFPGIEIPETRFWHLNHCTPARSGPSGLGPP